MKDIYIFSILMFLLGCNHKDVTDEIKQDEIEEVILEGYKKYNADYFSQRENCLFENFVENELDTTEFYYDDIFRGVLMKYQYCPYNNLHFNIIKGRDRYYYYGLMDLKYLSDLLPQKDYEIVKGHAGKINSPYSELRLNSDSLNDTKHLEFIVNNEFTISDNPTESELLAKLMYSGQFLKDCYSLGPYFERNGAALIDIDELETELILLKGDSLSKEERDILLNFGHPTSLYEETYIFKFENQGIIFFVHEINKAGEVKIKRYFLPQIEKWIRVESDLVRSDQYDC